MVSRPPFGAGGGGGAGRPVSDSRDTDMDVPPVGCTTVVLSERYEPGDLGRVARRRTNAHWLLRRKTGQA